MKKILVFLAVAAGAALPLAAQELFVFTEPASNMPAHTIGIRSAQVLMQKPGARQTFQWMPEIMWGVNKRLMVHAQFFASDRNRSLQSEGLGLYAKYRFYSKDDVHSHFRLAAFGRISTNNSHLHQQELETMGQNSGWESGMVATQLLHKVALSSSLSFEQVWDNAGGNKLPAGADRSAVNYTFSVGKLMLPKTYSTYRQTNLNLMLECLGQRLNGSGKSYLDLAPSVQFIFNSQARLDLAYRHQIYSDMNRQMRSLWLLKLEYTFFTL